MVEFGVLGPLRVITGGMEVDAGGGRRRGVLGRLLVDANRVVPHDRLLDDLSLGAGETAASTLRTYVSRLRRLVGNGRILTRPPGYMLVVDSTELDAARFESLLARAREPGRPPQEVVCLLEDAERLWRGPALAEFADLAWARPVAERLNRRRLDASGDRLEALLACGRHREAASDTETLVEQNPLDERLWGLLVLAHYQSGRQADALRAYQRARQILVEELGTEPGPALRELEGAVLRHDPTLAPARVAVTPSRTGAPTRRRDPAPAAARPAKPVDRGGNGSGRDQPAAPRVRSDLSWIPPAGGPLVGRRRALATIVDRIAAAGAGHAGLVLVSGEAGAGKTRLLAELARRADEEGCLVLFGRCEEDGLVPFQAIVPALAPALRQAMPAGLVDLGPLTADLAVLLPDLESATSTPMVTLDADTRRHRLFEAIDRCFEQLARQRTVVLIVDDLHLADRAVLRLLHRVVRASPTRRMVVVSALRATDVDPGSAVLSTLLDLRNQVTVVDVTLRALRQDEVAELLVSWTGHDLDDQEVTAQRIHRETGGNPLFVTELVRDLRDGGVALVGDDRPLPASVADVVASRVARMQPTTQRFLQVASVVGMDFDYDLVTAVAALGGDAALDALDEALRRGILLEIGPTCGRLGFSHAIVRRGLYERLSSRRRARLHLAVAHALERGDGGSPRSLSGPEPASPEDAKTGVPGDLDTAVGPHRVDAGCAVVAALAHHHLAAALAGGRNRADAVRYTRMAGDRAIAKLAYETGIEHYRQALGLLGAAVKGTSALTRAEVLLQLGEALNQGGDTEEAKEHLLEAAAIATSLGQADLATRAALAFGGPLPASVGLPDERGLALLRRCIARQPTGACRQRAVLLGRLAEAEYLTAPRDERLAWANEAVATARELGDRRTLATVLVNRYWALFGPDDPEAALRSAAEVERIAGEIDDVEVLMQGVKCQLQTLLTLDAWPSALRLAADQRRRARELRQPEHERLARSFEAVLAGNAGRFVEAEHLAREACQTLKRRGQRSHAEVVHLIQQVPWRWLQSRPEELAAPIERVLRKGRADPYWRTMIDPEGAPWRVIAAWMLAEAGHHDQAVEQLRAADLVGFLQRERRPNLWSTSALATWTTARLVDRHLARLLYDHLLPYRHRNAFFGQVSYFGCIEHHLGVLAAVLDRPEAGDHLRRALTRYQSMGATAYAAHVVRQLDMPPVPAQ
jgi:DNA-binding SARP family transcriptional activator